VPLLAALLVALLAACEAGIDHGEALPAQNELKLAAGRHCAHCGRIEAGDRARRRGSARPAGL